MRTCESRQLRRTFAALAAGGLVVLLSGWAQGSTSFPARLTQEALIPCVPDCIVCHQDNQGGVSTATKPFAASMQAEGLEALNEDSLVTALQALEAAGTDSDGDGTDDVTELAEGSDPNDKDSGASVCGSGPTYGCGARIAPEPTRLPWEALPAGLIGLGLFGAWRRRRAAKRSPRA